MSNQTSWTKKMLTSGLVLGGLGLVILVAGLLGVEWLNPRFLPAMGIFLLALGGASFAQYWFVQRDPKAGLQLRIQEQDERLQLIRARAGSRAYPVSSAMAFLC